jgi:hypothetical protein
MPLKVDSLNSGTIKTESLTVAGEPVGPKYKVYTALLTQSGGSDQLGIQSGDLTIGITYRIEQTNPDCDWTNVGAPNNNVGTYFVATGTTPNNWGTDGLLIYNTGAPVVTVLENTIGNIWFTYFGIGTYNLNSDGGFGISKYDVYRPVVTSCNGNSFVPYTWYWINTNTINLNSIDGIELNNDSDNPLSIEIRVYN